ncbi:uncharacterized protein LOC118583886 [Onychomys torridus]|uniref:uncharacterized protein LOC118583886 n=1 Tax=Onychomys torridus TaxID=38674 RepID=UPI00167F77AC|nr:uncharacterized protein LOC118583886 [Onychomys torridus]
MTTARLSQIKLLRASKVSWSRPRSKQWQGRGSAPGPRPERGSLSQALGHGSGQGTERGRPAAPTRVHFLSPAAGGGKTSRQAATRAGQGGPGPPNPPDPSARDLRTSGSLPPLPRASPNLYNRTDSHPLPSARCREGPQVGAQANEMTLAPDLPDGKRLQSCPVTSRAPHVSLSSPAPTARALLGCSLSLSHTACASGLLRAANFTEPPAACLPFPAMQAGFTFVLFPDNAGGRSWLQIPRQPPKSPACCRLGPTGVQKGQPLSSRMTKCATRGRRPELPTQGLRDAGAPGGHIWVPTEPQRRRGLWLGSVGKSGCPPDSGPGTGLPAAGILSGLLAVDGSDNGA